MPFKAGVIGKGFIGPAHVEALRRLGNVEVVAIAGTDEATATQTAQELGIPRGYGDWRELIRDRQVQVVHVCSPNRLHFVMAKEALEAGKHVVCEKPLALSVDEGRTLVETADRCRRLNTVHFSLRYYPLIQHLRALMSNGDLGDLFAVHGSYLQDWLYYSTDYNWRLDRREGGALRAVADIGSHWLDLVEFVTGCRIEAVLADFQTFHKVRRKPRKRLATFAGTSSQAPSYTDVVIDTEDYASVLLRFSGGARGVMTVSQVSAGRKNRLSFEVDGSRGAAFWDSEIPNQLWLGRRDAYNEVVVKDPSLVDALAARTIDYPGGHAEGYPDTFKQMFKDVYGYLERGDFSTAPTFPTFRDGLRELQICKSIFESNQSGAWRSVAD
ncbi:MAG TPA: Gfo/Idh/MocA family oxidoreductase [Gammaproteobacteria bacterium]|nr:Gfo/Idh/MocA family oxidoreductase [Gammaproteobacteria bacterium]